MAPRKVNIADDEKSENCIGPSESPVYVQNVLLRAVCTQQTCQNRMQKWQNFHPIKLPVFPNFPIIKTQSLHMKESIVKIQGIHNYSSNIQNVWSN
jgi:hypothetical protein